MIDPEPTVPHPVAVALGHLALLPFALGATLIWLGPPDWSIRTAVALSAYAAVVVSFIGGIYWGLGIRQANAHWSLFVWGVIPSLVAAPALMLEVRTGLTVHSAMLVACYLVDHRLYQANGVGGYLPLRFRLTLAAASSCLLAAFGAVAR